MAINIKFRIISGNKIVGYEKIVSGSWQWMCPELNPDNGERWTKGSFPDSVGIQYLRSQYTGRQDKKGIDIYVGDILGNEMLRCWVDQNEDGSYVLKFRDDRIKPISILDHKVKMSLVKGNIHENPELIECQQSTPA